ncbi:MAG: type I-E CRISPR-associated protein Cas6/Cse3/CasE [Proteobacteria bacterium]|nr:type I-E CRISPR-associated protein Cas6/Cse3/CasE [Pseudomonadota bacterium]
MILSRLSFDPLSRGTMKTTGDIYRLHETVMSGFKAYENKPRVLFRVEPEWNNSGINILVQSAVNPDWTDLKDSGKGLIFFQVKPFNPVLNAGACLRFRLRGNPTVKRNGKRYGLIRDDALETWMLKWSETMGVKISSFTVTDEGYISGLKKENQIRIKTARFDGRFQIVDPDKLLNKIIEGIGPAKGFGCGLLSIAPG